MQNSVLWKKLYHNPAQYVKPKTEPTVPVSARLARETTPEDYRRGRGSQTDRQQTITSSRPPVATQFPSKYAYLPDINSPRPPDRSLVPVNGRKQSPAGYNPNLDLDADERIRQLEVRLNVAEKSNRALLEEVLRLQGDIKTANRRNDEVLREEKGSRHNLESAMKINNELITQLSARIKEAEDKLSEEKSALSSLVNHTKGVEQAVKSSQNELIAKKDIQSQKLVEMRAEMEELQGAKNQLERICFSMADDIRTLKMKVDQQSAEIGTVSSDMRNRSKKLEDDNRNQAEELDTLRKTSTIQSQTEQQTTQLRGQVETRLSELRDVLVDVRAKQESELNERRTLEQQMSKKIYELQQALSEANRRRDEGMHTMDIILREKDHANQADKLNLTSKVADTVEDVNKRLLSKEIKMREEMQERYLQLERLIQQEQQNRRDAERAMREDIDRKFLTLKHATEELNLDIKEQLKNEKVKTKETVAKLDESISIVEKQSAENKKQFEKVMGAEISQRKMHEASTIEKLASVNEKLQIATSSLQQSIGGITQVMNSQNEKMKREIRGMMSEQKEASTRAMTDLDARMGYMKTRMNEFEDKLEARVATMVKKFENKEEKEQAEATAVLSQNLREKVDAISIWQDTTQQTIKELSTNLTKLPEELYALQEKQTLMKTDMDSRFTSESEARSREIELLKAELETMKERHSPLPATKSDLDNLAAEVSSDPQVQGSVRKLADSIQTVKTVLGMKIQSEQKLRVSGLENLQVQVNQIKANVGVGNIYSGQPDYRNDNGLDTGLGSWDDPTPHTSSSKNPNSSADQYPSTSRNDGKDTNTQMGTIPESGDTSRKTPVSPSKGGKTKSPANSRTVTPSKSRNVTPSQSRNNTPTQPSRNVTPNTGRNKKSPTPSTGKTGTNTARDGDQTNRQDGNKTPKGGNDTARDGNQTDRDGNQTISSLADV
ncbi:coiled-coil domain-containing protein 154 isoform X14 [Magallana gigas]|uniref:coiled-coil domain-containing protein 154 isoform X14 n=1 Tax=Magallana gigas TaxID=29159 RepID=UPI003341D134